MNHILFRLYVLSSLILHFKKHFLQFIFLFKFLINSLEHIVLFFLPSHVRNLSLHYRFTSNLFGIVRKVSYTFLSSSFPLIHTVRSLFLFFLNNFDSLLRLYEFWFALIFALGGLLPKKVLVFDRIIGITLGLNTFRFFFYWVFSINTQ